MPKKKKNSKIVMVDERRKAETGYRKTKTKARSAQDTVPFDECYENGLFRNGETFSIIFSFENVDYKVMRDNEKDTRFKNLRKMLPENFEWIQSRKRLIHETAIQHHEQLMVGTKIDSHFYPLGDFYNAVKKEVAVNRDFCISLARNPVVTKIWDKERLVENLSRVAEPDNPWQQDKIISICQWE